MMKFAQNRKEQRTVLYTGGSIPDYGENFGHHEHTAQDQTAYDMAWIGFVAKNLDEAPNGLTIYSQERQWWHSPK